MSSLSDLFPLREYNLEYYPLYLKEGREKANQIFDEALNTFLDSDNQITKNFIFHLLGELEVYSRHNLSNQKIEKTSQSEKESYFKEKNLAYYKIILNKYEKFLSPIEKFNTILNIPYEEIIESYIKNNYEDIKKILQSHIYINSTRLDELEDLFDYQIVLDYQYKNLNLKAEWGNFKEPAISLLYKYFHPYLFFLENNKIEKYPFSTLKNMNLQSLKTLYKNIPKEDISLDLLKTFIRILKESNDFKEPNEIKKLIESGPNISTIFKNSSANEIKHFLLSEPNTKMLQTLLKKENIHFTFPLSIYSINFLVALNKLSPLKNSQLKASSLYFTCFKLFLQEFLKNYEEKLDQKDLYTLEIIFRRSIVRTDPYSLLEIKNKKALYHNYKTDEIINNLEVDLDFIKNYNTKHYLELLEIITSKKDNNHLENKHYYKQTLLKSLKYLGYNNTKLILSKTTMIKFDQIIKFLESEGTSYKKIIIELFKNDIEKVFACDNFTMDFFFESIKLSQTNNNFHLTTDKLYKILNSISYALFPNNKHIGSNLEQLNLISKGNPFQEKIEGIKLYEEYRKRIKSTIPDYSGQIQGINYELVDLHSPEIISNGIGSYLLPDNKIASSCLTPNGKAASSLYYGAINPNGRFLKLTYHNKIIAYSWLWRAGEVLCIDNIEVTEELLTIPDYEKVLYDIYKDVANNLLKLTKYEPQKSLKLIVLGRNKKDIKNKYLDALTNIKTYQENNFKPNTKEKLYLKDSEECQLILAGEFRKNLDTTDAEINYPYHRPKVITFNDLNQKDLRNKLEAIYFDYCLSTNNKYLPQNKHYQSGYLGCDWYIGYINEKEYDFYYFKNDNRLFQEADKYLPPQPNKSLPQISIITPLKDQLIKILDPNNYEIETKSMVDYLNKLEPKTFNIKPEFYTHTTTNLRSLAKIIEEKGITSNNYGKRNNCGGCNGREYISVAQVDSSAYRQYLKTGTILLDNTLFAITSSSISEKLGYKFINTSYPLRTVNLEGEYHVPNFIGLEKMKAFLSIDQTDYLSTAILLHLEELYGLKIPIVNAQKESILEKGIIKKYLKIKNS